MNRFIQGLKRLPRFPYSHDKLTYLPDKWSDGFNKSEIEEMKEVNQKRINIMQENGSIVFSDSFVQEYINKFGNTKDMGIVGTITRHCGFDLSEHYRNPSKPLRVLQLGSGPGDGYSNGPKLHKTLESLGALVTSMDILDCSEHYPKEQFVKGSWLNIDSIFEKNSFDVLFTDMMNPELHKQIENVYPTNLSKSEKYKDLVERSLSITHRRGSLILCGFTSGDFMIPETTNDILTYNKQMQYWCLSSKHCMGTVQLYKNL